jgi:oligopeptide transport system substrate-binding protein
MLRSAVYFFLILFVGCNKDGFSKKNRPLCLNLPQDPSTFDPRKASDFATSTVTFFLYEGLVRSSPGKIVEPALAESYFISKDQLTYTFKIRDAVWSNGQPITAYDFERSWKESLSPEFPCPNAHLLYPIKNSEKAKKGQCPITEVGIIAKDSKTLEITLENPTPYFLELTSFCTFFPYREDVDKNPIFSGPFAVKHFKPKDRLEIEKSESYWDKKRVSLSGIRFYLIDDSNTVLEMFGKNEIDLMGSSFTNLPTDAIAELKSKYTLRSFDTAGTAFLTFNCQSNLLKNIHMRKALFYTINRQDLVENFTFFDEKVANTIVPSMLRRNPSKGFDWSVNHTLATEHFNKALEELQIEKEKVHIRFVISSTGLFPKIAQVIQEQIREGLGIKVSIEQLESKVYLDRLYKHDFDIGGCLILAQYHDPLAYLDRFKQKTNLRNYPAFEDAEFSSLIDQSFIVKSEEHRWDLLEQAETRLKEYYVLLPIYHFKNGFVASEQVQNIQAFPQGTLYLDEVEIL